MLSPKALSSHRFASALQRSSEGVGAFYAIYAINAIYAIYAIYAINAFSANSANSAINASGIQLIIYCSRLMGRP